MADGPAVVGGEDDEGVGVEVGLLQRLDNFIHSQVHVIDHGFVDIPGWVGGLRDFCQNFSSGLQGGVGGLEREVEEERLVITGGIQVASLRNRPDYSLTSLFEHNGGIFPVVFPGRLLVFSEVVESWRISCRCFVVPIIAEVVLNADIEAEEGVEASPGWSVL